MNKVINLREKILNAKDIRTEIVKIEEWDVEVEVKSLTGKMRAKIIGSAMDDKGKMDFEKLYPDLVIYSAYDPATHEPIFQPTDRNILNEKNGGALEKIAQVTLRLSGLDKESVQLAKKKS